MEVNILATGSYGNCITLKSGDSCILIDAGIAKTKIEKRLFDVGIRPDEIETILITHAHGDHIKGVSLANKYRIPVYAGAGEWKTIPGVDEGLRRTIKAGETAGIGFTFGVTAFDTHHDAMQPLGYVIEDIINDTKCAVCLDTGRVDDYMLHAMQGCDIYIIEANHEPKMVETSDYPLSVQTRILSDIGHLSNQQTADALNRLIQGRGEQIYLTHLSHKNNLPTLAQLTVENVLRKQGFKVEKHYQLEVIS
ncbi:MBL fold metallo-hydrolase [Halalkalibacter oceani]|uniref:MBL fold metallo-hydrolase n=1 Tax=Halalkalibacter oceani TaxID=1653776 RepID=UPI0033986A00